MLKIQGMHTNRCMSLKKGWWQHVGVNTGLGAAIGGLGLDGTPSLPSIARSKPNHLAASGATVKSPLRLGTDVGTNG